MLRISTKFIAAWETRPDAVAAQSIFALARAAAVVGTTLVGAADVACGAEAPAAQAWSGFADIVEKIKPAVISVRAKLDKDASTTRKDMSSAPEESPLERFFHRFGQPDGDASPVNPRGRVTKQGSGFFILADGYAVTSNHVIEGADVVDVTTDNGKMYAAKVVGADERTDIALIKVDGRSDFPTVKFSDKTPRVGDWVLAVGNPFGLGGTVTAGIVSARGRDIGAGPYDDFIQIDAPVNEGNSGGPTFNVEGEVIGVNTAIVSPSGGSVGIAFAIPAETVKSVVMQLKDKGKVIRGWIGVQVQSISPDLAENLGLKDTSGALVAEPQPNGPAIKAGIESGDVITAINGKDVVDSRDFVRTISAMPPGTSVVLTLLRKGEQKTVTIALGELPTSHEATLSPDTREPRGTRIPQLGFSVAPKPASGGVVITELNPDGVAAQVGMKVGDLIIEMGGKKVANANDVRNAVAVAETGGKRTVLLRLKSGDVARFVTLPVGHG